MWIAFALLRGGANVILTFAFFYGVWWYLFTWMPEKNRQTYDPIYARDVFSGHLPVAEVLATRRFHAKDAETWDCTYAIVRLGPDAPEQPPTWIDDEMGWQFRFGGQWVESPRAEPPVNHYDHIDTCAKYWPMELSTELKDTLYSSGAWFVYRQYSDTLFLYSNERRLAARIRFGD
jgi:hypothetical protein